jgi:hypothetical protein
MDLTIVLTLEYLFDKDYCVSYLKSINIDSTKYKYVYWKYSIDEVEQKKIRSSPLMV